MCRLLVNHVISLITPLPVHLHHSNHSNRSGRGDYIKVIVQCRKHPEEGSCELAAMLVEGAWQGWNCLFDNLQQLQLSERVHKLGPNIIQKSKSDQVGGACQKGIQKTARCEFRNDITAEVLGETKKINVNDLKSYQYKEEA